MRAAGRIFENYLMLLRLLLVAMTRTSSWENLLNAICNQIHLPLHWLRRSIIKPSESSSIKSQGNVRREELLTERQLGCLYYSRLTCLATERVIRRCSRKLSSRINWTATLTHNAPLKCYCQLPCGVCSEYAAIRPHHPHNSSNPSRESSRWGIPVASHILRRTLGDGQQQGAGVSLRIKSWGYQELSTNM